MFAQQADYEVLKYPVLYSEFIVCSLIAALKFPLIKVDEILAELLCKFSCKSAGSISLRMSLKCKW